MEGPSAPGGRPRLRRVISLGSRDILENNELRYGVRLIDLDLSPLSEALLLWAEVPGEPGPPPQ